MNRVLIPIVFFFAEAVCNTNQFRWSPYGDFFARAFVNTGELSVSDFHIFFFCFRTLDPGNNIRISIVGIIIFHVAGKELFQSSMYNRCGSFASNDGFRANTILLKELHRHCSRINRGVITVLINCLNDIRLKYFY